MYVCIYIYIYTHIHSYMYMYIYIYSRHRGGSVGTYVESMSMLELIITIMFITQY